MRRFALHMLLASVSTLTATAALAQDAPEATAPPTSDTAPATQPNIASVGDIVVTAQRRSQNLLSVPLSIQAATGQQLNNTGIRQISSLQFTTPGLEVQNGVG